MQKKMKTKEIKKMRNRLNPDEVLEKIVSGKLVDVVYNSAIAAIDTADFKVSLLNATKDYEEISNIDKTILQ